ncbi:hypothetical protein M426DRAFT_320329 [Hypoxylon sp. CI-4A]|nr:hypothetical protein M426DRAFT_320329 [Hypoxylon sp. CI-4A]
MSKPTHLEPSKLGTKEYWDNLYETEITNHAHDPSDTGTAWFDDSDAERKLIEFLEETPELELSQETTSFLDLGTGNGALLSGLRAAGWTGRMLGVDYSRKSVEFARRIELERQREAASDEETADAAVPIEFQEYDILQTPASALLTESQSRGWDVVLDKGTFDAISLSSETDPATGRRVAESYKPKIMPLVRDDGGLFLVTSCNWTETELHGWFEADADGDEWRFEQVNRVEYPSFSFGGVKGQTISSICFKKVRNTKS